MATNDVRSSQSSGYTPGGMTYKKISNQLRALGIPEEVYKEKVWEAIRNKSKTIDFSFTVNNEDGRSEHQISLPFASRWAVSLSMWKLLTGYCVVAKGSPSPS
jgi:hypothetical protein